MVNAPRPGLAIALVPTDEEVETAGDALECVAGYPQCVPGEEDGQHQQDSREHTKGEASAPVPWGRR